MNIKLEEQRKVFAMLVMSLTTLSKQKSNIKSAAGNRKDGVRKGAENARQEHADVLRQQATKAQEDVEILDENIIYGTWIDPFAGPRQERSSYGRETMQRYEDDELKNLQAVFEESFMFWTGEHFKALPNVIISNLWVVLVKRYLPIERRPILRMSTALANYILNIRKRAFKNNDGRPIPWKMMKFSQRSMHPYGIKVRWIQNGRETMTLIPTPLRKSVVWHQTLVQEMYANYPRLTADIQKTQ